MNHEKVGNNHNDIDTTMICSLLILTKNTMNKQLKKKKTNKQLKKKKT